MKKKLHALNRLSEFLPGKAGCRWLTPGFRGACELMPFAVELLRDSSNTGVCLQISIKAATLFQLEMHKDADIVTAEGPHGLMDFDIIEDPDLLAALYLNDAPRRQYIWNFLSAGFSSFTIEKDRVRIIMHNCDLDEDLQAAALYIQILALTALAKDAA
ncbi:MAG TPA: hypothetical protein PKI19_10425 [Elusimicrobiales bacterium]|nr:hypothetical protein [Elusimicrobiales bacterium]